MPVEVTRLLIIALDIRTPEGEAVAALRVARKQIGSNAHDYVNGMGSTSGSSHEVVISSVRFTAFQSLCQVGYALADRMKLKNFRFYVLADPNKPNDANIGTVKFTFDGSSDNKKTFQDHAQDWVSQLTGTKVSPFGSSGMSGVSSDHEAAMAHLQRMMEEMERSSSFYPKKKSKWWS